MHYRKEIDGLRALAILPVVLFHTGLPAFEGGYLGVDVFFVISGYLITTLIRTELVLGAFTLTGFYARRVRRLLPALLFVMVVCIPASWALMLPHELQNFGQSLVATTLFSNNILHLATSGYFALPNTLKPLMHTWSLGIEEQYYLFFPALLLILRRVSPMLSAAVFGVLALASFAVAQHLCEWSPDAAFFLLPTRLWEFLAGALVSLAYRSPGHTKLASFPGWDLVGIAGLSAIGLGMFAGDEARSCSVAVSFLPVAGTSLVLLAATPTSTAGVLLGNRWFVGLGLLSYSLYLWHQPLFAFARLGSLEPPGGHVFAALSVVALALSYATWRFVEQPCRDRNRISNTAVTISAVLTSAVLIAAGLLLHGTAGFEKSWPGLSTELTAAGRKANADYNFGPLRFQDAPFEQSASRKILVLGDSFARDFINAALENGYFSGASLSYSRRTPSCIGDGTEVSDRLRASIAEADAVIIGSPHAVALDCWTSDAAEFARWGAKKLIVIGGKDFGWHINRVMHLPDAQRFAYRALVTPQDWTDNAVTARTIPSGVFVDVLSMIADATGHVPLFTPDHDLISYDRRHLTKAGARYVGQIIFQHPLLQSLK